MPQAEQAGTPLVALAEVPEIVTLAGGEFWMGQEDGRREERPVHCVRVSPFSLAVLSRTSVSLLCLAFQSRRWGFTLHPSAS